MPPTRSLRVRRFARILVAALALSFAGTARADEPLAQTLQTLGSTDSDAVERALAQLAAHPDPAALPALEALNDDRLRVAPDGQLTLLLPRDRTHRDPITLQPLTPQPSGTREVEVNNQLRRLVLPMLARLKLSAPDAKVRLAAAQELTERGGEAAVPALTQALSVEKDKGVAEALEFAIARLELGSREVERQLAALEVVRRLGTPQTKGDLERLVNSNDADARVRKAADIALSAIASRQHLVEVLGSLLHGLSLASILLLAALGLAVTFGLLGVINMAHGEMLMIGAYATYAVQIAFEKWFPGAVRYYLVAAIPVAFFSAQLVGVLLERTVIRHLYGRPLETLLATWGISLMLIQTVRLIFGAQNVAVANPDWLSGGVTIAQGLVFPYNRLAVIAFVILVAAGVYLLLQKTRLGLQVRAVTQNRSMAACLGIATSRIDMKMFGLGSGIAGLGGVALSQLGNVGPELGQAYVIDSFMVVVLGGVGRLAGSILASLGLGIINKTLEPFAGAVLGKIVVLGIIILFIQRRPQGIFALKGRVEG